MHKRLCVYFLIHFLISCLLRASLWTLRNPPKWFFHKGFMIFLLTKVEFGPSIVSRIIDAFTYHNFWYKVLIFWHFSSDDVWYMVFVFDAGEEKTPRERWQNGWASPCPLCQSILILFIGLAGFPLLLYLVCSKPSLVTEFSVVLLIDWYNWRHKKPIWYSWDPLYAAYWNLSAFNLLETWERVWSYWRPFWALVVLYCTRVSMFNCLGVVRSLFSVLA